MRHAAIVERLLAGHHPRTAEMDASPGPDGRVCSGHGMGYPPPWPCLEVQAADEIGRLRAENEALRFALQDCSGMSFDEIDESYLSHLHRALGDDE